MFYTVYACAGSNFKPLNGKLFRPFLFQTINIRIFLRATYHDSKIGIRTKLNPAVDFEQYGVRAALLALIPLIFKDGNGQSMGGRVIQYTYLYR
jgi:hypothetical protein